jgi:tRNA-Thr(GGU) m(6)t(6)A37 methyltransferase TsaA
MATPDPPLLHPIGVIHSPLTDRATAPRQGDEGGPDAWITIAPEYAAGLEGLAVGQSVILITWLHQTDRTVLTVHPRGDTDRPPAGVFATRSPDRPNPLGLHRVAIRERVGPRLRVGPLEAIDGTPVVDIKPVLGEVADR